MEEREVVNNDIYILDSSDTISSGRNEDAELMRDNNSSMGSFALMACKSFLATSIPGISSNIINRYKQLHK